MLIPLPSLNQWRNYAFGAGDKGQLGIELVANQIERGNPQRVEIDVG